MKKQLLALAVISAATAVTATSANAERYFADNSVTVLGGGEFKLDGYGEDGNHDYSQTTYTIEHVSGYSWGGLFFFMDADVGEDDWRASYSEFSPKFYAAKFENSVIKTINLAFTMESGSSSNNVTYGGFGQDNYLWGVGADLAIPGMNYASATYYYCVNDTTENDHQITLTYGANWGGVALEGYIDYSTGDDDHKASFNFNPQLTYDLGPVVGYDNKLKVGIEYSSWHNKYGSEYDEDTVAAMVKMHF